MFVNGRDLTDDGWILVGLTNWMAGFGRQRGVVAVPNVGGVIPATQQTAEARQIQLTFRKYLTTLSERDAAMLALQDRLSGRLWVRFIDAPNRVLRCYAGAVTAVPAHAVAVFAVATIEATVTLTAYDGASYDVEPRVLALATMPTEIELGTLPSVGTVYWGGAWTATTARTLIYRDHAGAVRKTMTFTAPSGKSLGSTDYLEIDLARRYITKVTSAGARTSGGDYDWYTSGGWIALDPAYQDRTGTRYGSLEISAGTAQITYRKAWAL